MRRLANAGLSLMLSGLLIIAIAVVGVPAVTGTQPVTITASSMQDVLPLGTLVYVHPEPEYHVGEYVTFRNSGQVVTHEIVAAIPNPATGQLDGTWFRTQGTQNAEPDPNELHADKIVGRVLYQTPYMGIAVKTLGVPVVQVFLVLLAVAFWLLGSGHSPLQRRLRYLRDMTIPEPTQRPGWPPARK